MRVDIERKYFFSTFKYCESLLFFRYTRDKEGGGKNESETRGVFSEVPATNLVE